MANTRSAKIANRKAIRRTLVNRTRKSRIRATLKKLEAAITAGNHKDSMAAFREVESALQNGVSTNIIKKNTADRKVSRLNARVKALATTKKSEKKSA